MQFKRSSSEEMTALGSPGTIEGNVIVEVLPIVLRIHKRDDVGLLWLSSTKLDL